MANMLSGRVRLGVLELDLKSGELRSLEAPTAKATLLREQVLQVLQLLVERGGEIVTREEIKSKLWANDTVVDFDHSINATIKSLRRALGDSADDPRYIETLARRGYRLMVPIEYPESVPETALEKEPEQREHSAGQMSEQAARVQRRIKPDWWKTALLAVSAVILVAAGYLFWWHLRAPAQPETGKIRLAVLPFQNLTGDPNKEYLADGLTEQMISQLSRLNPEQLGVIARTSVMGYKHKDVGLDQIGRDLSVQYVLENSLRESGDQMRLTAQLIQVKDQTHLWSQDFDYAAKDILNVEDEVAKAVAREIQLRLTSHQQAELARPHTVNPQAFDAYLQANYHAFQRRSDRDTDIAAKYYERATQLDPSFALAWVGLSDARNWQADEGLIPMEEGRRLAREAVERALALNPNLPEAHIQMGKIKRSVDFDWAGANASFQRAIALDPLNPDAVYQAAWSAAMFGRFDEARQLAHRAVDLDPLNAVSWVALGLIEFSNGQLDQALADCKKSLELNPDFSDGPLLLSQIYLRQGRPQDALPEIERIHFAPLRAFSYALTYFALGREKESDAALNELITKYYASNAVEIAEVYSFRNQPDKAFEWLDRAYAQHDPSLGFIKTKPTLANLRGDPRYAALLKKLNLPN
jgi:TolB-like protein/DNA-binding winged helix-turn-helix (wHTH) protein/cytochrome c-type biogenesis protein CcmH/NrfG